MKSILNHLAIATVCIFAAPPAFAEYSLEEETLYADDYQKSAQQNPGDRTALDTEDPIFMLKTGHILSKTTLSLSNKSIARLSEQLSIGVNDHLTILANLDYQQDFDGNKYGFSGPDVGGIYRILRTGILTDLLAGVQFSGADRVPEFAAARYYIGARAGKQWSWLTVSGTLQASWIFDETHGHAYIDLIPEAYFRLFYDWSLGFSAGVRKSTAPNFNKEWLGGRLAKRYGRTIYAGVAEYEFEHEEWRLGARLNILF
ncbi:MAG: hypothetical protein LBK26_04465 [Rickettsiales bacterium]|jgi:hypothetical protein|nr:hypothetical protein [Rickettsiales bacterium]